MKVSILAVRGGMPSHKSLLLLALLAAFGCVGVCRVERAHANSSGQSSATDTDGQGLVITVRGNSLLRNGKEWIPKGVTIVGRVAPAGFTRGPYMEARKMFGQDELMAAKRIFRADTVRFQVSEAGLDVRSSIFSAAYRDEVRRAIRLARDDGFAVIASMQWEAPGGMKGLEGMPNEATARAWQTLCPIVKEDPGVMLELFNEPRERSTPEAAAKWHEGMQSVLNAIRACGARNVVVLDGLDWGRRTNGLLLPDDPLTRMAFGVHPYLYKSFATPPSWDRAFGITAEQIATIATEWNATPRVGCVPDLVTATSELLHYLKVKRIGLIGWAMDFPNTLFAGESQQTLTDLIEFSHCGEGVGIGGGKSFNKWDP